MFMKLPALRIVCALLFVLITFSSCDDDDNEVRYVLTVSKSEASGGTVSPDRGTFLAGEVVRITVTPSQSYTFVGWQGDATGDDNPILITMNSDKSITAVFEEKEME